MARAGVNKAMVLNARATLLARGIRPSIDAIRVELGNTGSKSTIQRYLKELTEEVSAPTPPSLDMELQSLIAPLAERLQATARMEVADERQTLQRNQEEFRAQRQYQAELLNQLRAGNAELTEQLREAVRLEQQTRQQLHRSEVERQRSEESEKGLQLLLAERADQVRSLEEKHRHARESLEHYRNQQQEQRAHELQRHDVQIRQLQQEIRTLQEGALSKQNELGMLNRDNERLLGELRAHSEKIYELEKNHLKEQRKRDDTIFSLTSQLAAATQALSSSHEENIKLKERWKSHFISNRQCRRRLTQQNRQIILLQTTLQGLSDVPAQIGTT